MIDQENTVYIANLKAYLTCGDLDEWIKDFVRGIHVADTENKSIIVCPPASHLLLFARYIKEHGGKKIAIGVQDLSAFGQGAYTGELNGAAVFGEVEYALLGHSERRTYCKESTEIIQEKIKNASFFGMHSIVCVERPEKYEGLVYGYAYEPKDAIGTGKPRSPEEAEKMLTELRHATYAPVYLYGGSVNETDVKNYLKVGYNGVLVGTASKDPAQFLAVIRA